MSKEIIGTSEILMIGDTFRFNMVGSRWMTAKGFRAYKNAAHPELECDGLTKVVDVVDHKGRSFGITIRPSDSIVYLDA